MKFSININRSKAVEIEKDKIIYKYNKQKNFFNIVFYGIMISSLILIVDSFLKIDRSGVEVYVLIFLVFLILRLTLPKPLTFIREIVVNTFFNKDAIIIKEYDITNTLITIKTKTKNRSMVKIIDISNIKSIVYIAKSDCLYFTDDKVVHNVYTLVLNSLQDDEKTDLHNLILSSLIDDKAITEYKKSI